MKALLKGTPWYIHACMITSIGLVIAAFCVPPYAVIDGSVLAAVGELLGGATLITFVSNIPTYLDAGYKAKVTHGNTTIEIEDGTPNQPTIEKIEDEE